MARVADSSLVRHQKPYVGNGTRVRMLYITYGPIFTSEYGTSITSLARTGMSGSAPFEIRSRFTGIETLLPLPSLRISVASDVFAANIAPPAEPTAPSTVNPDPTWKYPGL